jgi:hypothetical protein
MHAQKCFRRNKTQTQGEQKLLKLRLLGFIVWAILLAQSRSRWNSSVDIVTGWTAAFPFPTGVRLFSTAPRPALGPTQPPIQRVPVVLPPGIKRLGLILTTHLHLVPKVKNSGAIPPLPPHVFVVQCSIKHRDNYTFFYQKISKSSGDDLIRLLLSRSMSDYRRGFELDIGLTDHLQVVTTNNHNTIADLQTLHFITVHGNSFPACSTTRRFLVTVTNNGYSSASVLKLSLSLILRPTVSRPVCLGI